MKTLNLKVPDRMAEVMDELVRAGWFVNESEIVRQALAEFIQHHRLQRARIADDPPQRRASL